MATGKIYIPIPKYIPMQGGSLASTSMYNFVRSASTPQGIYLKYVQNSPDNPSTGSVATAIIAKPTDNGDYSIALVFTNGSCRVSTQLAPNATAFTWNQL